MNNDHCGSSNIPMNEELEIAMRPSDGPEIQRKFIGEVVARGGEIVACRSERDQHGPILLLIAEFLPKNPTNHRPGKALALAC